jgi:hypothetical protein
MAGISGSSRFGYQFSAFSFQQSAFSYQLSAKTELNLFRLTADS